MGAGVVELAIIKQNIMAKTNGIRTGRSVASKASSALKSGTTSKGTKSIAASALGNRAKKTR